MKKLLTPRRSLAVPLLLASCACAWAQSLGVPAAEPWMGRPLDVTVPARFASSDARDECVHADVFYGEQRVRSVRATVSGPEQQRRVRIEADVPVDEPVVTVSLRAGCTGTVTRNYTLLPAMPPEPALAGTLSATPVLAAGAAMTSPLLLAAATGVALPPARPAGVAAAGGPPVVRSARALRAQLAGGAPLLRLEPVEPDARTVLRVSAILADPVGDAARRATAALLWKAIHADPQELLRSSAMLQKLEGDLLQLRQVAAQTRAEMALLRHRVDEEPWYEPLLAQVLALLVAAAAATAGMLWYRARRAGVAAPPWFEPAIDVPPDSTLELPARAVAPTPAPLQRTAAVPPGAIPAPARPAPTQPVRGPQAPPAQVAMRVETLAATVEAVEFLASLGLTSDAMDVLKTYLDDSVRPAPLAFFELMRLCGSAGDPAAVAAVRRRYARLFGVEAPRLPQLLADTGLEGDPELAERITRVWGTPQALDAIEACLFTLRTPAAPLTVQAGRDLVCLYELAMALAATTPEADAPPLAPWADAADAQEALVAVQAAAEATGGHHFGLDVDLGAAPEVLPDRAQEDIERLAARLRAEREAARAAAARKAAEEDAFSAAVAASERVPLGRF